MEIKEIRLSELATNPLQHNYEESDLTVLADSIKSIGMTQPIVVTYAGMYDDISQPWVIISGHRRKEAKLLNGDETALCEIRTYESKDFADLDFIALNQYRDSKTEAEKISEIILFKQKLSQISNYIIQNKVKVNELNENSQLFRFLKSNKIDELEDFNAREIITSKYNLSKYQYDNINKVFNDEYRDDLVNKLYKVAVENNIEVDHDQYRNQVCNFFDEQRRRFYNGESSYNNLAKEIDLQVKSVKADMEKWSKKETPKKLKAVKVEKEPKPKKYEPTFTIVEINKLKQAVSELTVVNGGTCTVKDLEPYRLSEFSAKSMKTILDIAMAKLNEKQQFLINNKQNTAA